MNIDNLTRLRDELQAAEDRDFTYSRLFTPAADHNNTRWLDTFPKPKCGTAGCVAGWTLMLFRPGQNANLFSSTLRSAKEILELDGPQAVFLFLQHCDKASRADAIKRLTWLIENSDQEFDPGAYPWYAESWLAPPTKENR